MTDLVFQNSLAPIDDADLQRVAALIGYAVPLAVACHYRRCNGGVPALTAWELDGGELLVVSEFLPMAAAMPDRRTVESTWALLQQRQVLKPGLVPFALDWGGNYISFDAEGAVYFSAMDAWRAERGREDNIACTTRRITASFVAFVDGLAADPDA